MNAQPPLDSLEALTFDNRFVRELPADPETDNHSREVTGACYSRVSPAPVKKPELVAYSREVAEMLGFRSEVCETEEFVDVLAGNRVLEGMDPHAICYGGHQFGNWAGQLGDGRAINLGEIVNCKDEHYTLQLKGAGVTPYSLSADGLAVLRSSIREFLCSEAMHHLGIPTTRALSLVLTGDEVTRDMFYDGRPRLEPGAIVCRVAPSFTRLGNFEIFTSRGEVDLLKQLVDFTIRTDFSYLGEPCRAVYPAWLAEVCRLTAEMIVHWQRVGFVHGVMNTDNTSILGLTIDYGPYGWLEDYDPDWTPNTTDAGERRYRYGHQPQIAMWNLVMFANALYPLTGKPAPLEKALETYPVTFEKEWHNMMMQKLGLNSSDLETDKVLIDELLAILKMVETDMTIFYRNLAQVDTKLERLDEVDNESLITPLLDACYTPEGSTRPALEQLSDNYKNSLGDWLKRYIKRIRDDGVQDHRRRKRMNATNPQYVLRNYLAQLAIDKSEQGDHSMVNELLELLRHPYDEQPDKEEYAKKRPDWARTRAGCSMLSCSS